MHRDERDAWQASGDDHRSRPQCDDSRRAINGRRHPHRHGRKTPNRTTMRQHVCRQVDGHDALLEALPPQHVRIVAAGSDNRRKRRRDCGTAPRRAHEAARWTSATPLRAHTTPTGMHTNDGDTVRCELAADTRRATQNVDEHPADARQPHATPTPATPRYERKRSPRHRLPSSSIPPRAPRRQGAPLPVDAG